MDGIVPLTLSGKLSIAEFVSRPRTLRLANKTKLRNIGLRKTVNANSIQTQEDGGRKNIRPVVKIILNSGLFT